MCSVIMTSAIMTSVIKMRPIIGLRSLRTVAREQTLQVVDEFYLGVFQRHNRIQKVGSSVLRILECIFDQRMVGPTCAKGDSKIDGIVGRPLILETRHRIKLGVSRDAGVIDTVDIIENESIHGSESLIDFPFNSEKIATVEEKLCFFRSTAITSTMSIAVHDVLIHTPNVVPRHEFFHRDNRVILGRHRLVERT